MGWIDSAEPVATKGPSVNTRIKWHLDYYLTGEYWRFESLRQSEPSRLLYTVGRGRIKRGPASLRRPDPGQPRIWKDMGGREIRDTAQTREPYAIVLYMITTTVGQQDYTTFKIAYWPVGPSEVYQGKITIKEIYDGKLEELMGLQSNSIIGAWFSPIPYQDISDDFITHNQTSGRYWWETDAGNPAKSCYELLASVALSTTDIQKFMIVDPMGTIYGTLPWGIEFDGYQASLDVGSGSAFLNVNMTYHGAVIRNQGMNYQIPLISAPITSNNRSDYILSGQQEYDRTTAAIQQEQNLKSGIASVGTSAIGGAIAGGVSGSAPGAIAGAALGAVASLAGTYMGAQIQKETDAKSQAAAENLLSNQTSAVLISGPGNYWYHFGTRNWIIDMLERDTQSATELSTEHTELGYVTDSYTDDCTTVISGGGGLRIEGLEVKGDIPAEGRAYIAALFARGVHIDLIQ